MMNRIRHMLGLGRVSLVDDTGSIQRLQIDQGPIGPDGARRLIDKVARVAHFGLASVPPIGAEAMLARLGGDRSQTIALGTNHQPSRLRNLKPGDAALYDVRGAKVQLTATGLIIDCAGLPAVVQNFSTLTVMGDIHVTGDVISRSAGTAVSLNGLRDAYHVHKHGEVQAGTATTGTTDHDA